VRTPAEILVDPQLVERGFWSSEVTGGRAVLFPTRPFRFVGEVEAPAGTPAVAEGRP
jgi:crotonobetainyl-CoA:carnitine CoA-transferase CaiB-like acyl-CoA transferase